MEDTERPYHTINNNCVIRDVCVCVSGDIAGREAAHGGSPDFHCFMIPACWLLEAVMCIRGQAKR